VSEFNLKLWFRYTFHSIVFNIDPNLSYVFQYMSNISHLIAFALATSVVCW